jgi:hypothetical protein
MSATISCTSDPPKHYITEPLRSFAPEKLENGDIRMAIAKAGQKAYSLRGEEATLTKDFLSKDFPTWEGGEVSINHENNHDWVKATLYNPTYDKETDLVICSFSGLPDWVQSLIYSEDYQGLSQECIPVKFAKNSSDVIRGFGTKYPTEDFTMSEKTGGGPSAISTEAYESIALEKVELRSQIQTLESEKKTLETELASWKTKYSELESGEAQRIEIAISEDRAKRDAEFKAKAELDSAKAELKTVMSEEAAGKYLATNPTIEQIKSIAAIMKVSASKGVGSSSGTPVSDEERELAEAEEAWNSSHVRL